MHGRGGIARLVLALVVVASTAGCGSANPPGPDGAAEAVEEYFSAFAEGRFRVMTGLSTGDAHLYATYLVAGQRSANGPAPVPDLEAVVLEEAEEDGDVVRFTGEVHFTGGGPSTFRDFEVVRHQDRWLVADFARDGRPLGHFVTGMAGKSVGEDIHVAAALAFRDPSGGSVAVPVAITNERAEEVRLESYTATLTAASTGRSYSIEFSGPGTVPPDGHVDLVLVFTDVDDADGGGTLAMAFEEPGGQIVVEPPLEVPPFELR